MLINTDDTCQITRLEREGLFVVWGVVGVVCGGGGGVGGWGGVY